MSKFSKFNHENKFNFNVEKIGDTHVSLRIQDLYNTYGQTFFKLKGLLATDDAKTISKISVTAIIELPISGGADVYLHLPDFMYKDVKEILKDNELIDLIVGGEVGIKPQTYEKNNTTYYKVIFGVKNEDFNSYADDMGFYLQEFENTNTRTGKKYTAFCLQKANN